MIDLNGNLALWLLLEDKYISIVKFSRILLLFYHENI